ncbi:lipopolysaccharide biosynthesis protein [Anaerosinus sp.]
MENKIFKIFSVYFLSNLLAKIINFIFFAYLSRLLSIEEMGQFSLINMAVTILSLFMLFEIQSGFNRYYLEQEDSKRKDFEISITNLLILVNVVIFFIYMLLKHIIGTVNIDFIDQSKNMIVILLIPLATGIVNIYQSKMRLVQNVKKVACIMLIQAIANVASFFCFFYLEIGIIYSLILSLLFQNIVIILLFWDNYKEWKLTIKWTLINQSLKFSLWLIPSTIGSYFSLLSGKYFLGKFGLIKEVGIYEGNNRVANNLSFIMEPIYMAIMPVFYNEYKLEVFKEKYYKILSVIFLLLFLLLIFLSIFAKEVTLIILGEKYINYIQYLYLFIWMSIFMFLAKIFAINIHLSQKSQFDTLIECFSGFLNVILIYSFISFYGLLGVVLAITLVYMIRVFLYIVFANYCFKKIKLSLLYISVYFLVGMCLTFMHFYLRDNSIYIRIVMFIIEFLVFGSIFFKILNINYDGLFNKLLSKMKIH